MAVDAAPSGKAQGTRTHKPHRVTTVSLDLKSSGSPWTSGSVATGLDSLTGVERRSGEYSRRSNVVPPVSRGMTTAV
jgi:hypothetical protein